MKKILNRSRKRQVILDSSDVNNNSQLFILPKVSSTLNFRDIKISVDKNQWKQVDILKNSSSIDRHYVIRRDENGGLFIQFGDGVNGAKPPTGKNNVIATYRSGAGAEGNIKNTTTKRKKYVKKERVSKRKQ